MEPISFTNIFVIKRLLKLFSTVKVKIGIFLSETTSFRQKKLHPSFCFSRKRRLALFCCNLFIVRELRNRNVKFNINNRPNLYYPFYVNSKKLDENGLFEVSLEKQEGWIEVYPLESQGIKTVWRWGKEKVLKNINIEVKAKKKQDGNFQIVEKYRSNLKRERSIFDEKNVRNEAGTLSIKEIFVGKNPFDYPKSIFLIKRLINLGTDKDDIILDFFAGSGTTGDAVMRLNAEDGGNRVSLF